MGQLSALQPGNMLVVSTASLGSSPADVVLYPSVGGGTLGTPTNDVSLSEFAGSTGVNNQQVALDGIFITGAHTSATAITVYKRDGTTVLFTITVPANQPPIYIPFGQAGHGQLAPTTTVSGTPVNGFAVKTNHASTTFVLFWRRVARGSTRR